MDKPIEEMLAHDSTRNGLIIIANYYMKKYPRYITSLLQGLKASNHISYLYEYAKLSIEIYIDNELMLPIDEVEIVLSSNIKNYGRETDFIKEVGNDISLNIPFDVDETDIKWLREIGNFYITKYPVLIWHLLYTITDEHRHALPNLGLTFNIRPAYQQWFYLIQLETFECSGNLIENFYNYIRECEENKINWRKNKYEIENCIITERRK